MTEKKRIGLIGLGNIGSFYAKKLLDSGFPLVVLDTDNAKVQFAVDMGAISTATPAEVAKVSDVIILSLPNSEIVESVMEGAIGILSELKAGQLVIDTSTCRPRTAVKFHKLCAEKNAGFLDSPLTRRGPGQILMVGGDDKDFASAEDVLACISYKYQLIGPSGSGQYLKMINQAIMANSLAASAEAVELANNCGLDSRLLKDYLEFDLPDCLFAEDYEGTGQLSLHYKDLGYLLEIAHDVNANIPVSSLVHEIFKTAKVYGDPNWSQNGIQSYYKRLNNDKR